MSRWIRLVVIVIVVAAVASGGWLYYRARTATGQVAEYVTTQVSQGDIRDTLVETGVAAASRQETVSAGVKGTVTQVLVEKGALVEAGDPLIKLENETLPLDVKQAELNLQLALEKLGELLGVDPDRALTYDGPVTGTFGLTSDGEGRVTEVLVKPGQEVSADTPLLRLVDDRHILFEAEVNKSQMEKVQPGQEALIYTDGFAMQGTPATVTNVDRHGHPEEGSVLYDVELTVTNPGALQEGMSGQVDITTGNGLVRGNGVYAWTTPITVAASRSGVIEDLNVKQNDWINVGDRVAEASSEGLESEIESQRMQAEKAKLNLDLLHEDVDNLTVRAAISGMVTALDVAVGDEVGGETARTLAEITGTTLEVVVQVDEFDVTKLEEGQPALVTVEALPGQQYEGTVTDVALTGTNNGGLASFDVTVTIPEPGDIRPGMTAELTVVLAEKQNVVRVPSESVTVGEDGTTGVVRVEGDGGLEPRTVKIGLRTDEWTEIINGLQVGERVVMASTSGNSQGNPGIMFRGGVPGGTAPRGEWPSGGTRPH